MLLHADTPPQQPPPCPLTRGCAFMNDDQIGDWGDVVEGGREVQKAEWNAASLMIELELD